MLGFDALGRLALGELSRPATGHAYAVLAAAAAATFTPTAQTQANTVLTTAGAGAITIEVVGQASATLAVSGASSFGAADELMSVASFAGTSVFTAVSYAFYADADAERACLHQEIVTALVSPEDKIAIVPFEDRVYRTPSEARGAGNQPRKRIC